MIDNKHISPPQCDHPSLRFASHAKYVICNVCSTVWETETSLSTTDVDGDYRVADPIYNKKS